MGVAGGVASAGGVCTLNSLRGGATGLGAKVFAGAVFLFQKTKSTKANKARISSINQTNPARIPFGSGGGDEGGFGNMGGKGNGKNCTTCAAFATLELKIAAVC
jgi:hypothetical protein